MHGEAILRPRYRDYVSRPIRWLYATKEDVQRIVDGTAWHVREFIEDDTDAFVAILAKRR